MGQQQQLSAALASAAAQRPPPRQRPWRTARWRRHPRRRAPRCACWRGWGRRGRWLLRLGAENLPWHQSIWSSPGGDTRWVEFECLFNFILNSSKTFAYFACQVCLMTALTIKPVQSAWLGCGRRQGRSCWDSVGGDLWVGGQAGQRGQGAPYQQLARLFIQKAGCQYTRSTLSTPSRLSRPPCCASSAAGPAVLSAGSGQAGL